MKDKILRKTLVFGIIVLFIVMSVIPSSGTINEIPKSRIIINDGSLSGYVNDTYGNPIEGALVRVYFHETYEENYSDYSGYYHVTNIPLCYCLKNATCSKLGYKTEWVLLSIVENTTYDFVLTSINNNPPSKPDIDGEWGVVIGVEFDYYFKATDPDGDDVRYIIDWNDGNTEETDFYKSGEEVTIGHTFIKKGTIIIRAKAEDIYGAYGPVEYFTPHWKNKVVNSLLFRFLGQFPLLRKLF